MRFPIARFRADGPAHFPHSFADKGSESAPSCDAYKHGPRILGSTQTIYTCSPRFRMRLSSVGSPLFLPGENPP